MKTRVLFLLVACLTWASLAHAATYHVSAANGNDANSCVQAQNVNTAKATIAGGISCLSSGDTLLIRAGTYNESINNTIPSGTSWSSATTLRNYMDETVTLKPDGAHSVAGLWAVYFGCDVGGAYVHPSFIVFDGIDVDGSLGQVAGPTPYIFDTRGGCGMDHIRITNSIVTGMITSGHHDPAETGRSDDPATFIELTNNEIVQPPDIEGYGVYSTGDDWLIEGNDMHDNISLCVHIYDNHRVPKRNIVRNNRCYDIDQARFFGIDDGRIGGVLAFGDDHLIVNNVIYNIRLAVGTPVPYGCIYLFGGGDNRQVYNNSCYNTDGATVRVDANATNTLIRNNIGFGSDVDGISDEGGSGTVSSNNLFTDPNYTDAAAGDLTLQVGSAAIDAGMTLAAVTTDILGISRSGHGAGPDIGAYEFNVPVTCEATAPVIACGGAGAADADSAVSSSADTTGAEMLVMTCSGGTGVTFVPTDSKGNTWVLAKSQTFGAIVTSIYYVNSATPTVGSGHTFTCTATDSFPVVTFIAANGEVVSPFDQQNGNQDDEVESISPGSITPSSDNQLVLSAFTIGTDGTGGTSPSINSGFTPAFAVGFTAGTQYGGGAGWLVQTTAAAVNPTWSWTGAGASVAAIASFRLENSEEPAAVSPLRLRFR